MKSGNRKARTKTFERLQEIWDQLVWMDAGLGNGIADWGQAKRHCACDIRHDNRHVAGQDLPIVIILPIL